MTTKDLIAQMSVYGSIARMLGVDISEETLRIAEGTRDGRPIGDHLVAIGAVTPEEHAEILMVQARVRAAPNVEAVQEILDEVEARVRRRRLETFGMIPSTDSGARRAAP